VKALAVLATARHIAQSKELMADVVNRYPENTLGKYYVDNQCIDC